jgi:hypothetical protein
MTAVVGDDPVAVERRTTWPQQNYHPERSEGPLLSP